MRRAYVFPLLLIAFGCSNDVDLSGTWKADYTSPGFSFVLTLTQLGTYITGTGTWTTEFQGRGTLLVAGTHYAPSVNLSLQCVESGAVRAYVGTVQDGSHITGALGSVPFPLVRP